MKRFGEFRELLLDAAGMRAAVESMAADIVRRASSGTPPALVGIQTGGVIVARRLRRVVEELTGLQPDFGTIDITLYRDDLAQATHFPEIKSTEISFDVDRPEIVLVDDVLYTGRTIRGALDSLMDLGRPRLVRLAVLMDRGGRELPIAPDFVGKAVSATPRQSVTVQFQETDGVDQVILEDLP